jgi:hypothetical protein
MRSMIADHTIISRDSFPLCRSGSMRSRLEVMAFTREERGDSTRYNQHAYYRGRRPQFELAVTRRPRRDSNLRLPGPEQGAPAPSVMDTGSAGVVASADRIPNIHTLQSLGPGRLTYSSSGRIMVGQWVVTPGLSISLSS